MKRISLLLATFTFAAILNGQTLTGKQTVEKLCGCFEVEFKYAETFSPDPNYKYHDREEISGGTELTFPVEVSDKKIVMQHLLIITDSIIVKHWREEWTYENPVLWKFQGDNVWTKQELKPEQVKGRWTQSVWEVSDAPRYQGTSEWIETDGKIVWQNTTDAPLPRREYTVRSDYNILKRTNRIAISDKGYVHEQDNQKIIRKDGKDQLLVEEKGLNTYVRLKDSDCAAGKAYWEKTKNYWTSVRAVWDEYMTTHTTVELKAKVDGKVMHEYLFAMAKDYAAGKIKQGDATAQIKVLLDKFVGPAKSVAHQAAN
jgi:hypothetical protein